MASEEPALKRGGREPDERLLIEAAQADPSRFADLYELHFERVYAFVARRIGDRAEVQDITADVFHQALANLGRFEWRGVPFAAWLFRIAANAIADHFQRLARPPAAVDPAGDAGARSLFAPAGHDYGERLGGVRDPFGNVWYIGHKR